MQEEPGGIATRPQSVKLVGLYIVTVMIIDSATLDLVGGGIGFVLTLCVLSYLIGDNPLYRAAIYFFVGTTAGYAIVIAVSNVLWPQVIRPCLDMLPAPLGIAAPLPGWPMLTGIGLTILLSLKLLRPLRFFGGISTALLVGVGAAVAIGGALSGTLMPLTGAAFQPLWPETAAGDTLTKVGMAVNTLLILLGTLFTLSYFYYGGRSRLDGSSERPLLVRIAAGAGQLFLGTAFGIMYAGVLAASMAAFVERLAAVAATAAQLAAQIPGLH